ncbi:MAG: FAD-dependent oxidoreductase [Methanomassiliicoccales archaeon]
MPAAVAVVGGGIAGVQAALDVANAGIQAYIIERSPSLGGRMAQLDKTFPTNDCSTCILSPKLVEASRHPLIKTMTLSEVTRLEGESPDFVLTIRHRPRYVREEKCVGCGICAEKCPTRVPSEFDMELGERRSIFIPFAQAVPLKYAIDPERCLFLTKGRCGICKRVCPAGAVDFEMSESVEEIEVGAVIVATGYDQLDPCLLASYGHGVHPGVLTGLEFERLLSPSGPTGGKLVVPGKERPPRSIVFAQCIGSRDSRFCAHCSRFCCMASIKQALVALEHEPSIDSIRICYIDLRTYGKDFDRYRDRAREEGVKFLKGRVAEVSGDETGLQIKVEDVTSGEIEIIDAEMVVLAMAAVPSKGLSELAGALGIAVGEDGFLEVALADGRPVQTTKKGIFAAGCSTGPKDIPDSVCEASAAAAQTLSLFPNREPTDVDVESFRDVTQEDLRVGVFVCRCGTNIASVVDVPAVVASAKRLPCVVLAEENLFSCSESALGDIAKKIEEERLNRVVVASCSPRTHEPIFRSTLAKAGLNPYLLEMVNIRDQCSWVHRHEPEEATRKAAELVRMGVAKATLLEPLQPIPISLRRSALVVGGGLAGMVAATDLAVQGHEVTLIEKSDGLGGLMASTQEVTNGIRAAPLTRKLVDFTGMRGVRVMTGTHVDSVEGSVGNFRIILSDGTELVAAVIILAPGGDPAPVGDLNIAGAVTSVALDGMLGSSDVIPARVSFVQCIGVRNERFGCSRFCCLKTLEQALALRHEGKEVNVLYRDLMFFQRGAEELYKKACQEGVRFFQYDEIPRMNAGRLEVHSSVDGDLSLPTDLVVLGIGMTPSASIAELSRILKVPVSREGFFLERHPKLAPVEFAIDGIYVAGCAQCPMTANESIIQGSAAAAKASSILCKKSLLSSPIVCMVDNERCRGCGECEALCKFGAVRLNVVGNRKVSEINPLLCKGCGVCAVSCPSNAIEAKGFTDGQLTEAINALLGGET